MNRTLRLFLFAATAFLLLALVAGIRDNFLSHKLATAQAQIDSLSSFAGAAARQAESDSANASIALQRAKDAEHARAVSDAKLKQLQTHADSLVAAAPDTCAPVIAALDAVAGELREALHVEREQHDSTKSALTDAQKGLADAQRALAAIQVKADDIELPHASWLDKLLPKAGVGVAAGVDPQGKFHVVAGVTLGWRVSL